MTVVVVVSEDAKVSDGVAALERAGHCQGLCKVGAEDPPEGNAVKEGADTRGGGGTVVFPTPCNQVLVIGRHAARLDVEANIGVGTTGDWDPEIGRAVGIVTLALLIACRKEDNTCAGVSPTGKGGIKAFADWVASRTVIAVKRMLILMIR